MLLLLPGDREARLPGGWRLFEDEDFAAHPSLVKGYIGPMGGQEPASPWWPTSAWPGPARGSPEPTGPTTTSVASLLGRDFSVDEWGSFAEVVPGDACPRCGHEVDLVRSVEAAHTFQLGTGTRA